LHPLGYPPWPIWILLIRINRLMEPMMEQRSAMLLELAHHLKDANIGVDLVFFDLEDYGQQNGVNGEDTKYPAQDDTWCLGSQYWAKNLPTDYIMPRFGILLDMVGGKNAVFPMEGTSMSMRPKL